MTLGRSPFRAHFAVHGLLALALALCCGRLQATCANNTTVAELGRLLCDYHGALYKDYVDVFKQQILAALKLRAVPTVTRWPSQDELDKILLSHDYEMQGDQPANKALGAGERLVAQLKTVLLFPMIGECQVKVATVDSVRVCVLSACRRDRCEKPDRIG